MSGEGIPNEDEKPDSAGSERDENKPAFAFSAYRPSADSSFSASDNPSLTRKPDSSQDSALKYVAISVLGISTFACIWLFTHPPEAPKKPVIKAVVEEAPKVEDPVQNYNDSSKQIDDLLAESPVDNESLYVLAKERLQAAMKIGDREKILKSADFAAATADALRLPQDAIKYYDLHILLDPDTKILEAKFRVYQRYGLTPDHADETELFSTRKTLVRTEDQLATNSSYPLEEMDIYNKLLMEHEERLRQMNTYTNSRDKYADLLSNWQSRKKAYTLMSQLSARQNNLPQEQDLALETEHPERQLKQMSSCEEFEQSKSFSKFDWMHIQLSPTLKAYVSADVSSLIEVMLAPEDRTISSVRFISLPACLGEKFSKDLFAVIPPMVYGQGADEIKGAGDTLKGHMLATLSKGKTDTANPVYLLVSRGLLAGFEVRHKANCDWQKTPSIDQILAKLPANKIPKRRYGTLSYSRNTN